MDSNRRENADSLKEKDLSYDICSLQGEELMQSYAQIALRIPLFNFFRQFMHPKIMPVNYTLSVTNMCPSRCQTCFIWKLYREKPELLKEELSTNEFTEILTSLKKSPFWITISGGEPFTRNDIADLCKTMCEINKPRIINIPTNGLLLQNIESTVPKILDDCMDNGVHLVLNLSIDGVGEEHDEIRGVKGNWNKAIKTFSVLRKLESKYPCLTTGIHTVISKFNIDNLYNIVAYIVNNLEPEHYVMEVAEKRSELFNEDSQITPKPEEMRRELKKIESLLNARSRKTRGISKVSSAFRARYYELLPKILEENTQTVPCMASFASCHINAYGDVWACCILGYKYSMGNLKDVDFQFEEIWQSKAADKVRRLVRDKKCFCPLANANYTNLLFNVKEAMKIARRSM